MSCAAVGTARRRKVDQPETPAQLHEHERFVRRYREAGLCVACAAQAGYGGQMGFTFVRPPCTTCAPIVAGFPVAKANGWRAILVRARQSAAVGGGVTLPLVQGGAPAHRDAADELSTAGRQVVAA